MKHFNTLVRILLYQHKDMGAIHTVKDGIFYKVPHIPQQHMNLCTDAAMNMLYKIGNKPVSSMSKNPHGVFEGRVYQDLPDSDFIHAPIVIKIKNESSDQQLKRIQAGFIDALKNGPFILGISLRLGGHSVLVTGIAHDKVIFNDPLTGANKVLSIQKLCQQFEKKSVRSLDIVKPSFLTKEHLEGIKSDKLPEQVDVIVDTKHKQYFTLQKMRNPCEALCSFLRDTVKKNSCSPQEKIIISQFLEHHEKTSDVVTLMHHLDEALSNNTLSEKLSKRLQSAAHYMNVPDGVKKASDSEAKILSQDIALTMKEKLVQIKSNGSDLSLLNGEASNKNSFQS